MEAALSELRLEGLERFVAQAFSSGSPEAVGLLKKAFLQSCTLRSELESLSAAFAERGVSVIVFKGSSLMWTCYPKPSLRPVSDLDLVLRETDEAKVREVFTSLGYRLRPEGPFWGYLSPETRFIDLHLSPLNQLESAMRVDRELFWRESVPMPELPGLRQFTPEMEMMVVLLHGLKHSFQRLIWLVDLALLLPRIDRERFLGLADQFAARRTICYLDFLLFRFFGQRVPEALRSTAKLSLWERTHLERILQRRATPWLGQLFPYFTLTSRGERWRFIWELVMPPDQSRIAQIRRAVRLGRQFLQDSLPFRPSS